MITAYVIVAYFKNEDFHRGIEIKDIEHLTSYPDETYLIEILNVILRKRPHFLYLQVEKRYLPLKNGR